MWFPDFPAIGFFISYIATSLLVLELLRLISTDANKREAERFLDTYTGAAKPPPAALKPEKLTPRPSHQMSFPLADLDDMASRSRTPSPTARVRHRRTSTSTSTSTSAHSPSASPARQSRTRSSTLSSTRSSSSRASSRTKHRASGSTDESPRRHASPALRRSREAQGLGLALQRLVRGKA